MEFPGYVIWAPVVALQGVAIAPLALPLNRFIQLEVSPDCRWRAGQVSRPKVKLGLEKWLALHGNFGIKTRKYSRPTFS
ncbi:MAG: hypothetical protein OXC82_11505 [Rhodobacteraceae bacterium]|nr:hypothetical protein [Paracoccaceae bacterium]MCY4251043.1 hypothetical protein [Paracoccaceae bacterium]